jgi:hypothetical protein
MTQSLDKHRYRFTSGLRAVEEGKHSRAKAEKRHGLQSETTPPPAERQRSAMAKHDAPKHLRGFGSNGAEDGAVAVASFDYGHGPSGEKYHGEGKGGSGSTLRRPSPAPKTPRLGWAPDRGHE